MTVKCHTNHEIDEREMNNQYKCIKKVPKIKIQRNRN